jgi:hypothetical protein
VQILVATRSKRRSAATWLLGLQVRIPLRAEMLVSCVYMVCCPVWVEASAMGCSLIQRRPIVCLIVRLRNLNKRRPRPDLGCSTIGRKEWRKCMILDDVLIVTMV